MNNNAPLPSSFDGDNEFYEESSWTKAQRRLREEPLVPLGIGLTCWALYRASRSIRKGDHHETNRFFRARIYAQAFTLVCMFVGSKYYADEREKRKVFTSAVAEKKALEKRDAWIRELEARDAEDREMKARREKAMGLAANVKENATFAAPSITQAARDAAGKTRGSGRLSGSGSKVGESDSTFDAEDQEDVRAKAKAIKDKMRQMEGKSARSVIEPMEQRGGLSVVDAARMLRWR